MRKDSVYAYGNAGLDYAESHGKQFTQARSSACWTLPATACLFTGLDVHEHGADTQSRQFVSQIPNLAEKLKTKGYKTVQITGNPVTTEVFGLDKGFDEMWKVWKLVQPKFHKGVRLLLSATKPRIRKMLFSKDAVSRKLVSDLESANCWGQHTHLDAFEKARQIMKEADKTNTPCFFFINLMETHFPYHISEVFKFASDNILDKFREGWSLYKLVNQNFLTTEKEIIKPQFREIIQQRQKTAWQLIRKDIDNFMREQHENKNNLVIFCSDHGDNFGELGWYYHFANVNEAGNRVPLFWLEAGDKTPQIIDQPISSKYIHHSILDAIGFDETTTLFKNQQFNFPMIQSYWYKHQQGTLEKYRYNQFLFVEGNTRYIKRNEEWYFAPLMLGNFEEEPEYQLLKNHNPLEEFVKDAEKRKFLDNKLSGWEKFSKSLLDKK